MHNYIYYVVMHACIMAVCCISYSLYNMKSQDPDDTVLHMGQLSVFGIQVNCNLEREQRDCIKSKRDKVGSQGHF